MSEVTYNASKVIFGKFGAFIKDVANEIGWEKTIEIYSKTGVRDGEQMADFLKTQSEETRMEDLGKKSMDFYNVSGWKIDYETTPVSLEITIHTCPMFNGFLENGLEVERINALCKSTHREYDKALKRIFPDGKFTAITKQSKNGDCIEKFTIPLSNT